MDDPYTTPHIKIDAREYVDLRVDDLRRDRDAALKVQDEKRSALELVLDLRIQALENQFNGYKHAVWVLVSGLGLGILLIVADILIRSGWKV